MDKNIFFTVLNSTVSMLIVVFYYPVFKANSTEDLYRLIETSPRIKRMVDGNMSGSYLRTCIFFSVSVLAYGLAIYAPDNDVNFLSAIISLLVLVAVMLLRTWKFRKLLGLPRI